MTIHRSWISLKMRKGDRTFSENQVKMWGSFLFAAGPSMNTVHLSDLRHIFVMESSLVIAHDPWYEQLEPFQDEQWAGTTSD